MEKTKTRRDRVAPPTLTKVNLELWRLYQMARKGTIDVSDASKLASVLNVLLSGLRTTEIEGRLTLLEDQEHNG